MYRPVVRICFFLFWISNLQNLGEIFYFTAYVGLRRIGLWHIAYIKKIVITGARVVYIWSN